MGRWKKSIPEGTRDILFLDCADKKYVEGLLKGVYLQRGLYGDYYSYLRIL